MHSQHTDGAGNPPRANGARRRSLRLKLFLAVALPVLALLVALVAIIATRGLNARAVSDSVEALETREKLNESLLLVFDAESATRGYLTTRRPEFFEVHDRAVSRLPGVLDELGALIGEGGPQPLRFQRMADLVEQELDALERLGSAGSPSAAVTQQLMSNKARLAELRSLVDQMDQHEQRVQRAEAASAERLGSIVTGITISAGVLGLVGGLAAMWFLSASVARRVHLLRNNARRLASGEPLRPVPDGGDEITELAATMEQAAELIAEKEAWLDLTLERGRLILFQRRHDDRIVLRGDTGLLGDLGIPPSRSEFTIEEIRQLLPASHSAGRDPEEPLNGDLSMLGSDGQMHHLAIRSRVVMDPDGAFSGMVVGVASDVTDRVRGQEALESAKDLAESASRAKDEFLSRMSHELRTPLNAVLGFAQLLKMDDLDEEQVESVDHILAGGRHLLSLINEVLDLSRIEAGKFSLSIEAVDLAAVVSDALRLMRPIAAEHQVSVEFSAGDGGGPRVSGDHQRLKQVFINLVSNAIKYNRRGGSVNIGWKRTDSGQVAVYVGDTGFGIPADRRQDLFTPFERLGAEGSMVEGTGLGLALSSRLAEVMGGSLSLDTTGPHGSTFVLSLPEAHRDESVPTPVSPIEPTAAPPDLDRVTVLYIEDNLTNITLVEELLRRAGAPAPLTAAHGRLGIELAWTHHPDLILLDRHLPDMLGNQVLRVLKSDPATADIPVIVISADVMGKGRSTMEDNGAVAFLSKPIDVQSFWAAVTVALGAATGSSS